MSESTGRKLYLGPRVRVLRRELGLNQTQMAGELGISTSYLNHLERNQRPLTAQILLRLANTYDVDIRSFVAAGGETAAGDLQEIFSDRILQDLGIPRHELRDVAETFPAVAEGIARLHRAICDLRRTPDGSDPLLGGTATAPPLDWLHSFLEQKRNHFPDIDASAEAISASLGYGPDILRLEMSQRLMKEANVKINTVPDAVLTGSLRYYDFHRKRLMLAESLPPQSRLFSIAFQYAQMMLSEPVEAALSDASPADQETAALLRYALFNYAAAAVLMPYAEFFQAAEANRYDLDLLSNRFGVSFEHVAHRLTSLDRQGDRGVPFFLLKFDAMGNVSKRFAPEIQSLSRNGGNCPRWGVHNALRHIGQNVEGRVEMPDGTRYLTIARAVPRVRARSWSTIVIGCDERHAARIGREIRIGSLATPIGTGCHACVRSDCPERSLPPVTRNLSYRLFDRPVARYPFRPA